MDFTRIDEAKLKVVLSAMDMEELELDYEDIDHSDPKTRRALVNILELGRIEVGFNPKKSKLFIEVFPNEPDGCVLYFTCLGAVGKKAVSIQPVIFQFDQAENLIDAACELHRLYKRRIFKSSLYIMKKKYRLLIYPLDYSDKRSVYFLSEFGDKIGEGDLLAAFIDEHGELIIEDKAIETLHRHFGSG